MSKEKSTPKSKPTNPKPKSTDKTIIRKIEKLAAEAPPRRPATAKPPKSKK